MLDLLVAPNVRIPRIFYPFLVYRSIIVPFLVVCAVAVPGWLVFRLYRRRTRAHRASVRRELLLLTVVVYLCGLAAATLEPSHTSRAVAESMRGVDLRPSMASLTCSSASMPDGSTAHSFCVRNARGNFVLFFPLGILLPLVLPHLRFWRGVLIAAAVSCSIEFLQYVSSFFGSYRTADINDVILNVLGACVGLAVVFLLRLRPASASLERAV